MKKNITILIVVLAVIVGLIYWGRPTQQVAGTSHPARNAMSGETTGVLFATETLYDFGTISMKDGKVNHEFLVTNNSSQPVNLQKIATSCMCTAAEFELNQKIYGPFGMEGMGGQTKTNITINPGESAILRTIYDPNAHGPAGVGMIDRFVYLSSSEDKKVQFEIKAVVTP